MVPASWDCGWKGGEIPEAFYAASVAAGSPMALQAETGPNATLPMGLNWQTMDIGYWGGAADVILPDLNQSRFRSLELRSCARAAT